MILSPLFLLAWIRIKRDSDGPVIYQATRIGLRGRPFTMYKFRTMVADADRIGGPSTSEDDPRLTRTGAMLRRYKLDELPQLVNVIKGDMSFVGPRPDVPTEVAKYTAEERLLLTVRPGITDWASLRFHNEGQILRGYEDPHAAYLQLIRPEKVRLGLEYVEHGTFKTDLAILLRTLALLLPGRRDVEPGPVS